MLKLDEKEREIPLVENSRRELRAMNNASSTTA